MTKIPRILFAGGGTGGHVYPAIAIADEIRRLQPDAPIQFAGTRDRMEWEAVPKAGYEINPITVSGLNRTRPLQNLSLPFKLARSILESRRLIRQFDPQVVVGTGGYVSGPVLLTASFMGVPIVIQEQNAYAGVTNRLLGKRAARIHVAFVEAKEFLPPDKCIYSGNPTRKELVSISDEEGRQFYGVPEGAFVLLIFGGSLGSRAINDAVVTRIEALLEDQDLFVLWQSGKLYFEEMKRRVPDHPRLRLLEYIDRMDLTYAAADLALCRAGAITCSELMVTGTPSILVPSPNVAEDHQTMNARSMASAGAAVMLPEPEMVERMVAEVRNLRSDSTRLDEMSKSARQIARPNAAENIARDVLHLVGLKPDKERPPAGSDERHPHGKESTAATSSEPHRDEGSSPERSRESSPGRPRSARDGER